MYREHFGLEVLPFKITPDPAFLYEHSQNRRVLNLLRTGLSQLSAISVVSGDVGTGKTTLILDALRDAPENVTLGLLSNYPGWADDILPWVLGTFDIPVAPDEITRIEAFRKFVERENAAGRTCVLIVDEAQNVSAHGFEQLRQLAKECGGKESGFNLILVGQTELLEKLRGPECAAISQRIGVTIKLGPMKATETDAYIRHRLRVAGGKPEIFDTAATAAVHRISGGYPRLVNLVCDTAMVLAYGAGDRHIGQQNIRTIGEGDSVLSHLPEIVDKAHDISISVKNTDSHTDARSDTGATSQTRPKRDILEYVPSPSPEESANNLDTAKLDADRQHCDVPEPEATGNAHFTVPAAPEPGRDPVAGTANAARQSRLPSQIAEELRPQERSNRRRGLRFVAGTAVAASVVAAGVVLLNIGAIMNGSSGQQLERASLEAAAGPPTLNRIANEPPGASVPLTDMPGSAFLDRALSAGFSDPKKASIDYARAALRGEALAAYYLGQLYETGDGVPRDLALARSWYLSVEESVRGARRRLKDLGPPLRTGVLSAPTPLLGGTLETGGAEFVWMSGEGADAAYFVIELSEGPSDTVRRLPPQEISALQIDNAGAAQFWRVIAVSPVMQSYAASAWTPLGVSDTPFAAETGDIFAQAVVQVPGGTMSAPLEALTSVLDASRIPYRVETDENAASNGTGMQIGYFFAGDEAAARMIADAFGAEADIVLATTNDRDQFPFPGQIVIIPAQP